MPVATRVARTDGAAVASPAASVKVLDRRETYKACARSWKRRPDVGQDAEFSDLCLRDAAAIRAVRGRGRSA